MRRSTIVLSAALLVSIGVSAWLWNELDAERARHAEISGRPRTSPTSAASAPVPAVTSTPARIPAANPNGSALQSSAQVFDAAAEQESALRRHLHDPRYLEAYRERRRTQLGARRDAMVQVLGFSAKEADAVIALLVDRQTQMVMEPTPVVDTSPDGLQRMRDQAAADERDYQERIRAVVGEDKRSRLENYLSSLESRRVVEDLRAQLSGADSLRDDQVEPLIASLHTASAKYEQEMTGLLDTLNASGESPDQMRRYREGKIERLKDFHRREHDAASTILSAGQIARLDESLQRDLEREIAEQRAAQIADKLDEQSGQPVQ